MLNDHSKIEGYPHGQCLSLAHPERAGGEKKDESHVAVLTQKRWTKNSPYAGCVLSLSSPMPSLCFLAFSSPPGHTLITSLIP